MLEKLFVLTRCKCVQLNSIRTMAGPLSGATALGKKGKLAGAKGGGPVATKKVMEVEKDAHKLVNYVCGSNIYKEGEDVKIKDDSEYPDWLWNLRIDGPKPLEEMDTDSDEYWRKIRKAAMRQNNKLLSLRRFN